MSLFLHHDALSSPLENPRLRTLALGLGVQSTTLLLLAEHGVIEPFDYALFGDTHWEPQAVYEHLRWLQSPNLGLTTPILTVSAGNLGEAIKSSAVEWQALTAEQRPDKSLWAQVARVANPPFFTRGPAPATRRMVIEGIPFLGIEDQEVEIIVERVEGAEAFGRLNRSCTRDYKIDPQTQQICRLLGIKPRGRGPKEPVVEHSIGITMDEIERMSEGCRRFIYNRHPLIELRWTRAHCIQWLIEMGYPVPPKSRCVFCPYQTDELWLQMQIEAPEDFAAACAIDHMVRHGLRGTTHKIYLHRACVPLEQIDFAARLASKAPQHDGFLSECLGACGL